MLWWTPNDMIVGNIKLLSIWLLNDATEPFFTQAAYSIPGGNVKPVQSASIVSVATSDGIVAEAGGGTQTKNCTYAFFFYVYLCFYHCYCFNISIIYLFS